MELQVWTTLFEWKMELQVWAFSFKGCSTSHPDEYGIALKLWKIQQNSLLGNVQLYKLGAENTIGIFVHFFIIILPLQDLTFKYFFKSSACIAEIWTHI